MLGDVTVRIVRSDGLEFNLGNEQWRIPNDGLENFANLNYQVSSDEIPAYDGAIITNKRVASQDRTIKAEVAKPSMNEELRAAAIKFFNPKYSYECYVTYMGRTRHCIGEQIGFKCSEGNIYQRASLTWSILCANPYMLSEGLYGQDLAEIEPRFGFPWVSFLPPEEGEPRLTNTGAITSVHVFSQNVALINDGDVPSGMRVVLTAYGDVVNPYIRIGQGYIRLLTTMAPGDEIELDASSRPPTVTMNGKNAMNLVDRNSSILNMLIEVGETEIEYNADDGDLDLSVVVYYKKQYLGI